MSIYIHKNRLFFAFFNVRYILLTVIILSTIISCKEDGKKIIADPLNISYIYLGDVALNASGDNNNLVIDQPIEIRFDQPIDTVSVKENITLLNSDNEPIAVSYSFFNQNKLVKISHEVFNENELYTLVISSDLTGAGHETFKEQKYTFTTLTLPLILESIHIDGNPISPQNTPKDVSRNPEIEFRFNTPVTQKNLSDYSSFKSNGFSVQYTLTQVDEKTILFTVNQELEDYQKFQVSISSNIENRIGKPFDGLDLNFYTELDSSFRFPEISDDELMTLVQQQTFKYFWDFGHPTSGLSRERNTSSDVVTIGGSGFGIMTILVGIERGFITRKEGVGRINKIVDFLGTADRFHGVWPHWMNGVTGVTHPFSDNDDGGDIVETAFMIQGLLTVRQYLNPDDAFENSIINNITALWEAVEWDWYTQNENSITWHWSPDLGFEKNMKVRGWNEALIVYVLAASSPTHTVSADVYNQGWARNGNIKNGKTFYDITLPLGNDYGGPLFFEHYSFAGLDPRNLSDQYGNYWEQARAHTLINRAYCISNPLNYIGYSSNCWGLTASDNYEGYSAHSPTNDKGVITPAAALSSFPYTPEESMAALKHFYYLLGDKIWGDYGFYDAFSFDQSWVASSYLAIDQGPVVVMIENYRSALLWELFMQNQDVQQGLTKLGFNF